MIEEAPGEEPTPRELAGLVARAREARVPAILIEPQLSPRIAEALAAELGAATVARGSERRPDRSRARHAIRS